jgi:hypothetical protein
MVFQHARSHTRIDVQQRGPEEGGVAELAVGAVVETYLMGK